MAARPWLPPDLSWLQHFTGLTTKRCSLPAGAPPPRAVSDLQLRTSGSLPRRRRLLGLFRRRIPAGLSNAAELKTSSRDGGMIIHLQMDDRTGSEVSPSDALTLSHLTRICGAGKSSVPVLKGGGPGVSGNHLPQASPAVRWAVTGSWPLPTGTEAALWSVLHSNLLGWRKSAPRHFPHHPGTENLSFPSPDMLGWLAACFGICR